VSRKPKKIKYFLFLIIFRKLLSTFLILFSQIKIIAADVTNVYDTIY
jgi:hypothetical protein